jgi:hypothetical protein
VSGLRFSTEYVAYREFEADVLQALALPTEQVAYRCS